MMLIFEKLVNSKFSFNEQAGEASKEQWYNHPEISAHDAISEITVNKYNLFYEHPVYLVVTLTKQNMQLILEDVSTKIGKEEAYRRTIRNILNQMSNDNGT